METGKQGLLDDIISSIDNSDAEILEKEAGIKQDTNIDDANAEQTPGLSFLEKEAKEPSLVDKLMSITDGMLDKEASENDAGVLLKIAEETISDISDMESQARSLGKIAAEEFLATVNNG